MTAVTLNMKTAILITKMKTMRQFLVQLQNKVSLQSFVTQKGRLAKNWSA